MPHDRKGRAIEPGDHVAFTDWPNTPRVGQVQRVHPGAETCNLELTALVPGLVAVPRTVTAREAELVRKADGSEPAAAAEPQADGDGR